MARPSQGKPAKCISHPNHFTLHANRRHEYDKAPSTLLGRQIQKEAERCPRCCHSSFVSDRPRPHALRSILSTHSFFLHTSMYVALSPTSLQTASASLAALSLSSPTVSHRSAHSAQPTQVPQTMSKGGSEPEPPSVDDTHLSTSPPQSHTPLASNSVNGTKSGRKRGTIFTCESCSKVVLFPSKTTRMSCVVAWLTLIWCAHPGLSPSVMFDETSLGTYPSMAGSLQVCVE